jgi:serine/threonine-protein kinase
MGEVYRADDLKLNQPVALKFLPRALDSETDRLERFFNEVRLARHVSHPAVCRVWDVGEAEGQHFLSMEYVDGENLASLLRRIGRLPPDKALDIARQVCAGLAAAHEKGVLHRDLKPANVMLDGQGKVRIADFGLAGIAESLGEQDARSGTPSYMSPEQLLGREVTVRSDIYGLGLLLYELFTGRRAFQGRTVAELTRKHRDERPIDPSAVVPDLDPAVERTILTCLEKEPRRRPPSALAVSAMLSGRDPLEAAIAAGDTPSPELVAAAGETGGLPNRVAWGLAFAIVAGMLCLPALQATNGLLWRVPVEKTPDGLKDRARELIERLGNAGPAADSEVGFRVDSVYYHDTLDRNQSPSRFERLRTGVPPVLQFWYRQSPRPLVASREFGGPGYADPPLEVTGMAGVAYDFTGRLVGVYVVPPQLETGAPAAVAPDWAPLFEAARLDPARFRSVDPRWTPPFHSDLRAAWEGAWPERPEIALRIEAAAYRGRPVWFQLVQPWTRPERTETWTPTLGQRVGQGVAILLIVGLIGTGAVLAQRNLRLGRGDRRGAFRLALAIAALGAASFMLGAHHVAEPSSELHLLTRGAGIVILFAALLWLFYLALEPYIRRLRPWTLVSWTRLLDGGLRDSVVGRDALIGICWGVAVAAFDQAAPHLSRWLSLPEPMPGKGALEMLLGARNLASAVLWIPASATLLGLSMLLLFLILRLLTRRDSLAAAAILGLVVVIELLGSGAATWLGVAEGLVVFGSFLAMLLRFGALCAIVGMFVFDLLAVTPLSYDLGSWTGSATAAVAPLVLILAALALRAALGGSTGLRRYLAGEAGAER